MSYPYARTKVGAVGASAVSVDLSGRGKELLLSSTTDCWVSFTGPAVANQSFFLPTDTPTRFEVMYAPELSVIQDSAGGFLSALEFGDVSLIQTVHRYFTSNASLLRVVAAATFSGDSIINTNHADTFSGDASMLKAVPNTVSGDSSLLATVSGSITGDCDLVTP